MIRIACDDLNIEPYISAMSVDNPFGCRISSLYKTYDYHLPFVDYWIQTDNNKCTSIIARLETSFILLLTDFSDLVEMSSFMRVSGAVSIICDGRFTLDCGLNRVEGPILSSKSVMQNDADFSVISPSVKEVYSLISKCTSKNFAVPSYESFTLDVSHKLNKKTVRIYGIKDNELISCIMTLAESKDSAVLGALATNPDFRRQGHGAFLIKYINNALVGEGKAVFLHRAPDENIEFYNKLGFITYGKWAEYK